MAAVNLEGTTNITNAAQEPEIESLCVFLIQMGAEIRGLGTSNLTICGNQNLNAGIEYTIIPDRIEAGTFLMAAAITAGNITITNIEPSHMEIVLKYLEKAGCKLSIKENAIQIKMQNNSINPVNMTTGIYPGFPTDLQAQWMALMTKACGRSIIIENIYSDRFTHIAELSRFGAQIQLCENKAEIKGMNNLKGAPVMSTDIRASASLIIAGLSAEGESSISRIYHIDRVYEGIEGKFSNLDANIVRVKA